MYLLFFGYFIKHLRCSLLRTSEERDRHEVITCDHKRVEVD